MAGGAAAADGRLAAGDQLLSVDGQSLVGITQEKVSTRSFICYYFYYMEHMAMGNGTLALNHVIAVNITGYCYFSRIITRICFVFKLLYNSHQFVGDVNGLQSTNKAQLSN